MTLLTSPFVCGLLTLTHLPLFHHLHTGSSSANSDKMRQMLQATAAAKQMEEALPLMLLQTLMAVSLFT